MDYLYMGEGLGNDATSGSFVNLGKTLRRTYPTLKVFIQGWSVDQVVASLKALTDADSVMIGGYSRGADYAPLIARDYGKPVAYLFQFQPSLYYPSCPVTSNVTKAFCVYNPWWFETGGLGYRRSYKAEGNLHTDMLVTMANDSHAAVQGNPIYQSRVIRDVGEALAKPKGVQV